jgi:hypothetical protein
VIPRTLPDAGDGASPWPSRTHVVVAGFCFLAMVALCALVTGLRWRRTNRGA